MLTVSSMALSIVLLLGMMIDGQELYPFKDLKKAIGIHIMFVAIAQISNLPQLIHAGALRTADEIVSYLLFAPIDIFVVESIYYFGEEYAWRGVPAGTAAEYIREAHGRYFAGNHMGAVAYAAVVPDL